MHAFFFSKNETDCTKGKKKRYKKSLYFTLPFYLTKVINYYTINGNREGSGVRYETSGDASEKRGTSDL